MKGADRSIKDSSGKTPLDLAIESDFKTVEIMIVNNWLYILER